MNLNFKKSHIVIIIILIFIAIMLVSIFNKEDDSKIVTIDGKQSVSIDSAKKIKLGGFDQFISVKTKDAEKPILLFIHGGPGFVLKPLIEGFNYDLESNFIVVNWDQRGAGNSYVPNMSSKSITLDQFIADAHELTNYLKEKYNKEKLAKNYIKRLAKLGFVTKIENIEEIA